MVEIEKNIILFFLFLLRIEVGVLKTNLLVKGMGPYFQYYWVIISLRSFQNGTGNTTFSPFCGISLTFFFNYYGKIVLILSALTRLFLYHLIFLETLMFDF